MRGTTRERFPRVWFFCILHPPSSIFRSRRGIALLVVMFALTTALVISLALLKTQSVSLQISRNGVRRDLALQAAQAGAAAALERLQSTQWTGVSETPSRTVSSDSEGTSQYAVAFKQYSPTGVTASPEHALSLVIESTGIWQSATDSTDRVTCAVEVVVQLEPRVTGRTIRSGDSANANDVVTNPGSYAQIQNYAVYAKSGTNSLIIDPSSSIQGPMWLKQTAVIHRDPHWVSTVRNEYLRSLKSVYVSGSTAYYPHPLAGHITFRTNPSTFSIDLANLGVPWSTTSTDLTYPTVTWDDWRTYRLYNNGFQYQAVTVTSPISNVTLRPTPSNPLGIFVCEGSCRVASNVTIQGTLVSTGALTIDGNWIHISSFNWRGSDGAALVSNVNLWPRLPAIVADSVLMERSIRAVVEGAVVVRHGFMGAGGDYELMTAADEDVTGTATVRRLQQPWSLVQIVSISGSGFGLDDINDDGDYAIWLGSSTGGAWYPIVGVDEVNNRVTVVGEVEYTTPTNCRIRRNRKRYTEIRGPVSAETHELNRPPCWDIPTESQWNTLYNRWENTNELLEFFGLPQVPFVTWLSLPFNFTGWSHPISTYGLTVEPTFGVTRPSGISYRWAAPLFTAYNGTGSDAPYAGYRWKVTSWKEVR
jgi:Tfp pilus assembly protein PilX